MDNTEVLNTLLSNARTALNEFESYTQEQVDALIRRVCLDFKAHAEELAREAVEETGMGNVESKIAKNRGAADGIWYSLKGKKSVGIIGYDDVQKMAYVAKPKGILSSVAPSTNPNLTVIFNACFGLKGRNVLIVAPHPGAKKSTLHTVQIINDSLAAMGAPKNLVQCIEESSIELTKLLMENSDVIIATGGANMVRSAYSSGHPAFGVGPGNVQTIFDRDYDYKLAVEQTVTGRAFDNGLICACNQSFIIPREAEGEIVGYMKDAKVFYADDPETVDKFRKAIFPDGHRINKKIVGQSPVRVAEIAGVEIPADTSIIVLKLDGTKLGADEPLCAEKLCPVAIEILYDTFEEAVEIARTNLLFEGAGHSASIHTNDRKKAEYVGVELPVSRVVVNQPGVFAANPALSNGFNPTSTLGCGSWGNNSISENLTYEHLINVSRIGWEKDPENIPSIEDVWAE